jgi:hypothetical protein
LREITLRDDGYDHQRIFALMIAPNDERVRGSYFRMLAQEGRFPDGPEVSNGNLRDSMGWPEIKEIAGKAIRMGIHAGNLLVVRATMEAEGIREASNRKASQALEKFYLGRQWGDGVRIKASTRQIEKYSMEQFGDVAHLWAAHQVIFTQFGRDGAKAKMNTRNGVKRFLRIASAFQNFGISLFPQRVNQKQKKPLLNPTSVWRIPANLTPLRLSGLVRLREGLLESISKYKHY